mmetsp:Transcript_13464/g.19302  ORF Transcript_13464/g.19302 Transcript_13464/m.19302 type:complete len:422 (+) Transcript_13464:71-1336(+)
MILKSMLFRKSISAVLLLTWSLPNTLHIAAFRNDFYLTSRRNASVIFGLHRNRNSRCQSGFKLPLKNGSNRETHSIAQSKKMATIFEREGDLNRRSMAMEEALRSPKVEVLLAVLVLLSCFVAALGTLQNLPPAFLDGLTFVENVYSGIFAVEYFGRWYLNGFSAKHFFKPLVMIDLIAIAPLLIQVITMMGMNVGSVAGAALINLRLFRILRLQRVLTDYETFKNFEISLGLEPSDAKPYQLELARVLSTVFTLLSVASGLIYTAEHEVNPGIPDYFTALYFGLTTLTTVGFGDIVPVTTEGKLVVSGSILFGVTVIPAQAAALAEALLNVQKESREKKAGQTLVVDKEVVGESPAVRSRSCDVCGSTPHRLDAAFCWGCGAPMKMLLSSRIEPFSDSTAFRVVGVKPNGISKETHDAPH